MKLTLALNIGSRDAKRLGLKKTQRGDEVSASKEVEDILLKNGWAIRSGADGPDPEAVKIARQPTNAGTFPTREPRYSPIGTASTGDTGGGNEDGEEEGPDFDSMTKADLQSYAERNSIDGVTASMSKDDMLKAVKRGAKAK